MTKRPTETHTVEINGANATLKLSSKFWYVEDARVANAQERR
jgi:hypothetical protein